MKGFSGKVVIPLNPDSLALRVQALNFRDAVRMRRPKIQTSSKLFSRLSLALYAVFNRGFRLIKEEAPDVGLLLNRFGDGFAGTVACVHGYPNQYGIFTGVRSLQLGRIFE